MVVAIIAGLAAGALWALAFIAPGLVRPLAASDLTLIRYAVFGASSFAVLAICPTKRWRPLIADHWRSLLLLALAGNTLYYLLLSEALQRSDTLLPTLVIGTLPVVMMLIGSMRSGQFSIGRFVMPAALILSGLIVHVGLSVLTRAPAPSPSVDMVISLGLAVAALASWAFYGLRNAELLAANHRIDIVAWTALTGVATIVTLIPVAILLPGRSFEIWHTPLIDSAPLLFWGAALGLLSSWLATWLWNRASRTLSGEILGYLIVSETVFAILYVFLLESRFPTTTEALSICLLVVGVMSGIRTAGRATVRAGDGCERTNSTVRQRDVG